MYHKPSITAAGTSTSEISDYSQSGDYPVIQGVDPADKAEPAAVVVEQDAAAAATVEKPVAPADKHKKAEKPPEKKGKKKHAHGKKISTVVSAEKNKRFNPKVKVQGWLDEWEPEGEE